MAELKRCPFCGGNVSAIQLRKPLPDFEDVDKGDFEIYCARCDAATVFFKAAQNVEELCAAWQKRYDGERRWIPVTERLPQQGRQYLVCRKAPNGETVIETLWHDGEKLWWNRLYTPHGKITHWMPLPEPPKGE